MVFVNILGLNGLIETAGTVAALGQLQTYAAMLARLCAKHRGFVVSSDIATKGIKVILTFGAPVAHEYSAVNAARFALDLNAELNDAGLSLQHRIGVNGGHVFAGEVGPSFRRQYTVMGDAVNLAARLMAAAGPGEVYASRDLLDHAGPSLCGRELPPMKVKGKEEPVAVCVLAEEKRAARQVHSWRRPAEAVKPVFGRRDELRALDSAWNDACHGGGRTVLIEGEAGVGKTRLVEEAMKGMSDASVVARAACFEHLQAAPFTPWVEVLQSVLGIGAGDSVARRTSVAQTYLLRHLPDLVEFGSLLNPLLSLSLPQTDVVGSLDAQTRRGKLFELNGRILKSAAGRSGCVVVVEDLHWMDDSSLALAGYLAQHVAGEMPVLLLLTTRPVAIPAELDRPEVARLGLSELSKSESRDMLQASLDVDHLPYEVGEALYEKTKGNPLFLEEVIHSLQAPGVLERILGASSVTRAAELAALEIPDRVQGLLMSRIDRLAPEAREVLKAGSVAGRSFDEALLRGMDDPLLRFASLSAAFDELIGAALVIPDEGRESWFTFRHALVQDVAYESLPFARRRHLHWQIARYLEAVQEPPDHAVLVHHYERAGDAEKTRLHALRASESSVAVYANLEAVDYLRLALQATKGRSSADAAGRSRIDELIGDSLVTLARDDEAVAHFSTARRRWRSPSVRSVADDALRQYAPIDDSAARDSLLCWKIAVSVERGQSAFKRALGWLATGQTALPPGRSGLAARILVTKGGLLSRLGRFREAVELGEEGLTLARKVGDKSLQAYALTLLDQAFTGLGLLERAIECDQEAIALYEEVGDLVGQGMSQANLAVNYLFMGEFRAAFDHNELSLALFARIGNIKGVAIQHLNIGGVLLQMGELEGALEHLEECLHLRDLSRCRHDRGRLRSRSALPGAHVVRGPGGGGSGIRGGARYPREQGRAGNATRRGTRGGRAATDEGGLVCC